MARKDKEHVNLDHARQAHQIAVMKQIVADDKCPFCMENLMQYHTNPILFESEHWILTENFAPYDGVKKHYLLISKKHYVVFSELSNEAWLDLFEMFEKVRVQDTILGGTIVMRWGDTEYTSATVTHLHAQLITGASKEDGGVEIITAIGYKSPQPRKKGGPPFSFSSNKYWTLKEITVPFGDAEYNYILTPKGCVGFWELSSTERAQMFSMFTVLCAVRDHHAGAFIMRFGDTAYSGSEDTCFQVELIIGASREAGTEKILIPLGYKVPKEVPSS